MKQFLIFSACLFYCISVYSQWEWSNPLPQGNTLKEIFFLDQNTGYIVGNKGSLLKTTNGGDSFELIDVGTDEDLNGVYFLNDQLGFIAASRGTVFKTQDGGQTWLRLDLPAGFDLTQVYFINENIGFAGGYGLGLLYTTDGGMTWERRYDQPNYFYLTKIEFTSTGKGLFSFSSGGLLITSDGGITFQEEISILNAGFQDMSFMDGQTGFAVVFGGNDLYKTIDGGYTWIAYPITPELLNDYLLAIYFQDELTGFISVGKKVLKTIDGGNNWETVLESLTFYITDIFSPDNVHLYVTDYHGNIYISDDNGANWTNARIGSSGDLRDCQIINDSVAYALAELELLKTNNGGNSWNTVSTFPGGGGFTFGTCFHFINENIGFIGGTNFLFKTEDGGVSISENDFNFDNPIRDIYFLNNDKGILITRNSIYLTENQGATWSLVESTAFGFLNEISFIDQQYGYIVADDGLLSTSNGGLTWTEVFTGNNPGGYSVFFQDIDNGFILNGGTVSKTTDGGNTWTKTNLSDHLGDIFFWDDTIGYGLIAGSYLENSSSIVKTTDGGQSWSIKPIIMPNIECYQLQFVGPEEGYVHGVGNLLLKTTDGGDSWLTVADFTTDGFLNYYFMDELTGFVSTASGKILKTDDGSANWSVVYEGIFPLNDIFFKNSLEGFAVGKSGSIIKTIDGGNTWSIFNAAINVDLFNIVFPTQDTGYIAGRDFFKTIDGGNTWERLIIDNVNDDFSSIYFKNGFEGVATNINWVFYTVDGGLSWSPSEDINDDDDNHRILNCRQSRYFLTTNYATYESHSIQNGWKPMKIGGGGGCIAFSNTETGFIGGAGGSLMATTDGGENWTLQPTPIGPDIYHITFRGAQGFLVGNRGMILKTENSGGLSEFIPPADEDLLLTAYPNPGTNTVIIGYEIAEMAKSKLEIFDINGQKIKDILNGPTLPGIHHTEMNIEFLQTGIYLIRLQSGNKVRTEKLVVVH
jgi:photosystem II stability/assembly factor-like uncharacterized protein